MINFFRVIFSKFDEVIYHFRIIVGMLLVAIGLWAEINLFFEIKRTGLRFLSDVHVYYNYSDDFSVMMQDIKDIEEGITRTREERKINHNYHILIGLSTVAGAILLSKRKES
jgi:dolichol kinase